MLLFRYIIFFVLLSSGPLQGPTFFLLSSFGFEPFFKIRLEDSNVATYSYRSGATAASQNGVSGALGDLKQFSKLSY